MNGSRINSIFGNIIYPNRTRKTAAAAAAGEIKQKSSATADDDEYEPLYLRSAPSADSNRTDLQQQQSPNPQDDDHLVDLDANASMTSHNSSSPTAAISHQQSPGATIDAMGISSVDAMGISTSSSRTTRATNVPLSIRGSRRSWSDDEHDQKHHRRRHTHDTLSCANHHDDNDEPEDTPLLAIVRSGSSTPPRSSQRPGTATTPTGLAVRARKSSHATTSKRRHRRNPSRGGHGDHLHHAGSTAAAAAPTKRGRQLHACLLWCCRNNLQSVNNTVYCMNVLARLLLWSTMIALVLAVFWYSYELFNHGTEPHLIAWFSAGAFVLLGFPISMWGIVSHLANYNQPHVQVYVVRILWMVPIYSVESWLAMRFHKQAIYIETLRDFYESYVLYSFLQFLIQVLGGEESLILMLKDKSPTRGFHMWGLQWCVKPWLTGQPIRKIVYEKPHGRFSGGDGGADATTTTSSNNASNTRRRREIKRVHWKSPFFVKCKFGVLQYVLLKLVTALAVLLLEFKGWYKDGEFSWKSGYGYICALTNISQCWALYCLIFFYYATHTELGPIRPVGKFLAVKALVFFTWWQSVIIALLYQWGMIPDALVNAEHDWTKEDVAKGIQDYMICIEMFFAAVIHTFVFPHTEYSPLAVEARTRALNQTPFTHKKKRLGRNKMYHATNYAYYTTGWGRDDFSKSSGMGLEMTSVDSGSMYTAETWEDPTQWQPIQPQLQQNGNTNSGNNSSTVQVGGGSEDAGLLSAGDKDESPPAMRTDEHGEAGRCLSAVLDVEDEDENTRGDRDTEGDHEEEEEDGEEYGDEYSSGASSDYDDDEEDARTATSSVKPGFVSALLDSAIPRDLGDNTIGLVKGDYHVEKKTLLHHATTSDQYDLFSPNRRGPIRKPA